MKNILRLLLLLLVFTASSYHSQALIVQIFKSESAPTCPGGNDGYVVIDSILTSDLVVTTGPPPPFRFIININTTPAQSFNVGDTIKNLGSNIYTISILDLTDNSPAFDNVNFTGIGLSTSAFQIPASCFGNCDGTAIVVTNLGGTAPYTYLWDDPLSQTTATATNLCAGLYNVTVSDANGCTSTNSTTVGEPTQIQPNVTTSDPLCNGDANGTATAAPTGGSGVYPTYTWSSSANTTATETGLSPGSYTVTVTDNTGCTNTQTFVIGNPPLLTTSLAKTDIFCFGTNTGTLIQSPSGGTPPYTFAWNDSPTTQNRNNLFSGTYTVTVTDNNGCTASASRTINESPDININLSVLANNVCNGGAIGAVSANISGGATPYTFAWRGGPSGTGNTTTFSNLTAGFYPITVTDRFNCTKIDSIEVTEPTAIAISVVTQTDPTCNGGNDGTITISATGGTVALDYSYAWNAPGNPTTAAITNLAAGTYIVTVTDDNSCTATQSITLNPPVPILPNVTTTLVTCFGGNDGTATANPTGGTPPYTYTWSSSANTTFTETNLSAGNYVVTVTDNNGCTGTEPFTINQPPTAFSTSFIIGSIFCFGNNTGSIITNVSGGVPPYTFDWADLPGTSNFRNRNNLFEGSYELTVTDNAGCTVIDTAVVQSVPEIILAFNQTNVLCAGDATGSATVNISGGQTPYSFVWTGSISGNGNTSTLNNLSAGTYTITVTDRFNCVKIDSVTITEPSPLIISRDAIVNPTCNGSNDGSISITVSGGISNYTYAWNDISILEDRTNLTAGTYTVTVTDNNNCTAIFDTTLINPISLTAVIDSTRDPSCNGTLDGYISVLAAGGTGAYTYLWNNAVTLRENNNIAAATYTVTVTDNNGCTTTAQGTLNNPASVGVIINSTDESCSGANDGTATAIASGGSLPYTFLWDPNGQTTSSINSLSAGSYTVTVTDLNGCTDSQTVVIQAPLAVIANITVDSMASCNGIADGGLTASGTGGTPPYTFNWNNSGNTASITGLAAGPYTVTVTDNNGCTDEETINVTEPAALSSIISSVDPTCTGVNDGTATATVSGGTLNYTYAWATSPIQTTATATGLGAGTFTVTITDNNGCSITDQAVLNTSVGVTITLDTISDVSCNGGNDGYIGITTSSGVLPYTYIWNNAITTDINANLLAGDYTVTVADNNGCLNSQTFRINQPTALSVSLAKTDQQCFGDADGEIIATGSGGTAPYTFSWFPNVGSTDTVRNLNPGLYTATITDGNGCTATNSTTIGIANPRTVVAGGTDVSCNGGNDGAIAVIALGGAGGFSFIWNDIGTGPQIRTGLTAGTYTVTSTDANGCTDVQSVLIRQPDTLNANLITTDVSCSSTNDGTASVTPTGGTAPYTFNWGPPISSSANPVNSLSTGNYSVTVTDNNGCTAVENFTINQDAADFTLAFSNTNVSCNGGNDGTIATTINGGTGPFTFTWNPFQPNQPNITGLTAGTYQLTVSDPNGCTRDTSIIIGQPSPLLVTGTAVDETCSPGGDGTITLTTTGGTPNYSFNWIPVLPNSPNQTGLNANTYFVTVTDANGCTDSANFVIGSQGNAFTIALTHTDISCNGAADGSILVTETPAGTYNYNWTGGLSGNNPTVLLGGTYTVTVTDPISGCTQVDSATVNEPSIIAGNIVTTPAGCGTASGTVTSNPSGGNGSPYTFSWNVLGTVSNNTVANVPPGTYDVTITDASSCTVVEPFVVNTVSSNIIPGETITDADCNGACNGSISLAPAGGVAPYFFNWGGGITSPSRTNLCAGNYLVTITDNTNCDTVVSLTVGEPPAFTVAITTVDDTCVTSVGSATINSVSGGSSPYTFTWPAVGVPTGNTLTGVPAGGYDVTITDNVGCSKVEPFNVGNVAPFSVNLTPSDVSCFGGSDGSISVLVIGGTSPVTYDWTGGLTGTNPTGLTTGTYTLTVTDATGCGAISSINVDEPDLITTTISTTDENCIPGNDGTATAITIGGTGAYTYSWPAPGIGSGNTVTGLPADPNYVVTITDANGCSITEFFVIGSNAAFNIAETIVDASCNGAADGSISLSITGATNPLTYNWNPPLSNSPNQPNLAAGIYNVTVTDGTGCSETRGFLIREADALTVDVIVTDESCVPGNDGTATTSVTGGTLPYSFAWTGTTATTPGIVGLTDGFYTVTVTDANGCTADKLFKINSGSTIGSNPTIVRPSCFGGCDGSITIAPTGGVTPFTINWFDNSSGTSVSGLCLGSYGVTITDANGCSKVENISVSQPQSIRSTFATTTESCNPGSDGTITANAQGGSPPYTYDWGSGQTNSNTNGGYVAGTYSVTIFDANNCQRIFNFDIDTSLAITVSTSITNPATCTNNGDILVSVSNATNPLTYNWNTAPLAGATPSAPAGTYTVTVTDGNGCTDVSSVTVPSFGFPLNDVVTSTTCNGDCDGSILLSPSGGIAPYTYLWDDNSSNFLRATLCAGDYDVTVTDNTGCSTTATITVNEPDPIAGNITAVDESCNPGNDGSATANPTGGTGAYTYLWSFNNATTSSINALIAGVYTVTITDVNGCTGTETTTINGGGNLVLNEVLQDASCNGVCDGSIVLNPSGGTAPYTFLWNNNSSLSSRNALCTGNYDVTVTDNTGCSTTRSFPINEPSLVVPNVVTVDESCNPGNDGSASANPSGGTGPYTFLWSFNNSTANSITGLAAGSYTVTVTDNTNCSVAETVIINSGGNISINESITDASCNANCDGSILLNPSGGIAPYTYLWDDNSTNFLRASLCAGNYDVTVTDNTGCSTNRTIRVDEPAVLLANVVSVDESCSPGGDGSASSIPSGGTSPYTYLWSFNSSTNSSINNLSSGSYTVTVTDANNCSITESITINTGSNIIANETITDASCNGICDGSISLNPSGGDSPYTFNWSTTPPGSTNSITAQCAGTYTVTITDNLGCSSIQSFDINQPDVLVANATATDESCNPGSDGTTIANPTGGTAPYTYLWNPGGIPTQGLSSLSAGSYTVTVTDANNCSAIQSVNVNLPNPNNYTISSTDQSCNGGCDGTADITIPGGSVGFNFVWSPIPGSGQGTANVSGLCVGEYKVTITGATGCTAIDSVTIDPFTPILPNEAFGDESCGGICDGFARVNPTGGVGAYTYVWTPVPPNGQGNPIASNLCPGTYDLQIIDATGCDTVISFTINSGSTISGNIGKEDQSCGGIVPCDGKAFVSPSGGTTPYTFNWGAGVSTNILGDTALNLCNGNYNVTITDASGCSIVESTTITSPIAIDTTFIAQNSTCNACDGSLTVNPIGGTSPYTFSWFDSGLNPIGSGTNSINSLCSGVYFVDISDNVGCSRRFAKTISDIGAEQVTVSVTDVSCFNGNDGEATANFTCTDPNCSILWLDDLSQPLSPSVTSQTVTNLTAGNYFVEVTNNSGCKRVVPLTINQPTEILVSDVVTDANCNNSSDGSINLTLIGGTAPYTFNWSPTPGSGQGTAAVSGLNPGNYDVTVTDDNGCQKILNYNVGSPQLITASFTQTLATCNQSNGSITATVNGGTIAVDYSYQWFDGSNNLLAGQINATLSNVSSGTYILRVRDDNSCEEFFTTSLGDIGGPIVVIDSIRNVNCSGGNDGAIFITATDANTPLTYNWLSLGQTTEDITNLIAGSYTVEVTNSVGCLTAVDTTINSSSNFITNISTEDANCGLCNGVARVTVNGGVEPYTYLWSNGSTVDTTANLCAGAHTINITDANGCTQVVNFSINTDIGPSDAIVSTTAPSCFNTNDGSATVTPVGGTTPYTYLWLHDGSTTNSLSNLSAGSYFLLISDSKGCSRNIEVQITGPSELILSETIKAASCNVSPCDGEARVNVSGGVSPYTYSWSQNTSLNNNFADELCSGIYVVTVSDANGCSAIKSIIVPNNSNNLTANPSSTDVSCFGSCDGSLISNITPSVGISFQWYDNQGQTVANINNDLVNTACAGDYILEVVSIPDNCKAYASITINEPDSILLGASIVKNISCNGACDGEIFISTLGGNILYAYSWDDPDNQEVVPAINLCAGTYSVTATDANGCTATTSVTLVDPPVLELIINSSSILDCSSDCDAEADISAIGGVSPYTFNWSGGQVGNNPTDLCFGPNIVTISDATGCSINDTVFIAAIDTVFVGVPLDTIFCDGDSIELNGLVLGSTVNSFAWYDSDTTTIFTRKEDTTISRPIGTYSFFLIATNGSCNDTVEYKFSVKPNPILSVTSTYRVFKDESRRLNVGGRDNSYSYLWTPPTFLNNDTIAEPISTPDKSITYTLTVRDSNNCLFVDSSRIIYTEKIEIPSGLSPNGDGVNDTWSIEILEEFPNAKVQVFNRWGELLFEQNNGYNKEWDGTFEGKALPIGTYYYIIDLKSDRLDPITGPITIVR